MIIDSAKYSCPAGHDVNEDSCFCSPERGIYIVADGLGGHSSGETASLAAIDYFEENCCGCYTDYEITNLLEGANTEVMNKGDGGKTTVAASFIDDGKFIYANVGDSRVYYFRKGKIIAVTKDHSVCQASVDMGMLRPEDIRGNEDRSRLLKVLGSEKVLNIKKHYAPIEIQDGDAFLICSDGFWEYVYETEMEVDLLKSASAEIWLKYMLKRHILRAENKGDNYTAICGIIHADEGDIVQNAAVMPAANRKIGAVPIAIGAFAVIAAAAACIILNIVNKSNNGDTQISTDESLSLSELVEITDTSETSYTTVNTEYTQTEATTDTSVSDSTASDTTTSSSTASQPILVETTTAEELVTTVSEPVVTPAETEADISTTTEQTTASEIITEPLTVDNSNESETKSETESKTEIETGTTD